MASYLKTLAITALLTTSATLTAGQSGSGITTRYWYAFVIMPVLLHLMILGTAASHLVPGQKTASHRQSRSATSTTSRWLTSMPSLAATVGMPTHAVTSHPGLLTIISPTDLRLSTLPTRIVANAISSPSRALQLPERR